MSASDIEHIDPSDISTAKYLNNNTQVKFTRPLVINTYCAACVFFDTSRNKFSSRGMDVRINLFGYLFNIRT